MNTVRVHIPDGSNVALYVITRDTYVGTTFSEEAIGVLQGDQAKAGHILHAILTNLGRNPIPHQQVLVDRPAGETSAKESLDAA